MADSGSTTFLVKTGASRQVLTATIDDTVITNGGVLIQIMALMPAISIMLQVQTA